MPSSKRLETPSYWRATLEGFPSFPSLQGEESADVIVVGGGLTGLNAALALKERGFSVVLLDASVLGAEASGRNGGQVCTGYSADLDSFDRALSSPCSSLYFQLSQDAKADFFDTLTRYNISCHLTMGHLTCALRDRHWRDLETLHHRYQTYGYQHTSLLEKKALRERLESQLYCGALYDAGAGHCHPLKYVKGLAEAFVSLGGKIFEHSRVVSLECDRPCVWTEKGIVRSKALILACGASLGPLVPDVSKAIMPVASYIATTVPLGEERAQRLIAGNEAVTDNRFVMDYFSRTPDHRLLFGGRCSYSGWHPRNLGVSMRQRIAHVFPQLKKVEISHAWGGYVDITWNRLPHLGKLGKNAYYAQGYCGQGVVLSGFFGKMLAKTVAGEASSFDLFSRIPHRTFPGGPFKRVGISLGMLSYRLKDLFF